MLKTNYHTHTKYCNHAVGSVFDYVEKAIELGITELGMSDHAPILESFMDEESYKDNWCDENMSLETAYKYLDDIKKAKKLYGNKINILSGFETEYLPNQIDFYKMLREKVDYLNVGIHYYLDRFGKIVNTYDSVNYDNVLDYADAAIGAMSEGIFNCLVHPDLYMYGYKSKNGIREFDDLCALAARKICEAAIKYDVYLEINANGIKNSLNHGYPNSDNYLYPYKAFWEIAREYKDLKIIIGADAHDPEHLGNKTVLSAIEFAENLKINVLPNMEVKH